MKVAVVIGLLLFPCLAHSWTLTTRNLSAGGSLNVAGTVQTGGFSVSGTYASGVDVPVTVSPNAGYKITALTVNGASATVPADGSSVSLLMGLTNYPGVASQSVTASYDILSYPVTVKVPGGLGTSSVTSASYVAGSTCTVTFYGNSGYQLVALAGLPTSYSLTPLPASPATLSFTVNAPATITAYFKGVVADAGATQMVLYNSLVTLDGSKSYINAGGGTLNYNWAQTGGESVTLDGSTSSSPHFVSPSVQSTLTFLLTVSNGVYTDSATTTVYSTSSLASVIRASCNSCHSTNGVESGSHVYINYSASAHLARGVTCWNCHIGANTGGHPGTLVGAETLSADAQAHPAGSVDWVTMKINALGTVFCYACHNTPDKSQHYYIKPQVEDKCSNCHYSGNAGNFHNGMIVVGLTLGMKHTTKTPLANASFIGSASACSNCHKMNGNVRDTSDDTYKSHRDSFSRSLHGDVNGAAFTFDAKNMDGCVRCHTPAGFRRFSTGMVVTSLNLLDPTRTTLSCDTCHKDFTTGEVRTLVRVQPYPNDSYVPPDAGPSNVCVSCHSGTLSGRSIKAMASAGANFIGLPFTAAHFSPAAGMLFGTIGYEYDGRDYENWHLRHDKTGINNYTVYGVNTGSAGPCVTCHMISNDSHSFQAVYRNTTGNAVSISTSCGGCHTGPAYLDIARLNTRTVKFSTMLLAFQKVLESKGIYYAEVDPDYFYQTPDNTTSANAFRNWGNPDTYGAAFNFWLLSHDKGAYAHNSVYAKRLVYDSIEFLAGQDVAGTISGLSSLTAAQKSTVTLYLMPKGTRP